MDVMMPRKDGVEACRDILDLLPETKVLMLTASTEDDAVIEAIAAGADGLRSEVLGERRAGGCRPGGRRGSADDPRRRREAGLQADTRRGSSEPRSEGADGEGASRSSRSSPEGSRMPGLQKPWASA